MIQQVPNNKQIDTETEIMQRLSVSPRAAEVGILGIPGKWPPTAQLLSPDSSWTEFWCPSGAKISSRGGTSSTCAASPSHLRRLGALDCPAQKPRLERQRWGRCCHHWHSLAPWTGEASEIALFWGNSKQRSFYVGKQMSTEGWELLWPSTPNLQCQCWCPRFTGESLSLGEGGVKKVALGVSSGLSMVS